MLLANISVAKQIAEAFPTSAMLRRHPPPNDYAFDSLQKLVGQYGFTIDVSSPRTLQQVSARALRLTPLSLEVTRCHSTALVLEVCMTTRVCSRRSRRR